MILLVGDLGGTRMKLGLVRGGEVLSQVVEPSNSEQGLAPQLPVIKAAWLRMLDDVGIPLAECTGVVISFPSLVDHQSGRILDEFGKYSDAVGIDLRAWSHEQLGLPLAIENDARMACIGEWQYGAGRGTDNLVMVTLGTGLGTCAIMEGKVMRGVHGQAGVLGGHTTLRYGGRACPCGNTGCAEAEASTTSLAHLAANRTDFATSAVSKEPVLDFESVIRQASGGDTCAIALREHSLLVWSSLAVNLIHSYDPEVVIFGGGIMSAADLILPALREHIHRHAHTPWGRVRVEASLLGDQAALVASEWLFREQSTYFSK
ncbi:ROK family protein [Luteolibacter arcticus]|uniref:ROK family protein n=1 Tax=Luteolibacter arcticus TaxID=1581411 RepID=A0ABT3GHZ2_9BACT|nr:ROK family protein [Luteolibacter arcticus]MCW1923134.1 ROK family protein [Luteolibacter arcticus]